MREFTRTQWDLEQDIKFLLGDYGMYLSNVDERNDNVIEFGLCSTHFDTMEMSEEVYNLWENMLYNNGFSGNNYSVAFLYDASGYNYWHNIMEESNYTHISILVTNDITDAEEEELLNTLIDKVDKMFCEFKDKHNLM